MADVLTKRVVETLRTMTAAMFGPLPQKIEGVYTVLDLCDSHEELRRQLDEAVGIGPGMNDGPYQRCTDCGRRMVWDDPDRPTPTWTCPRCCVRRMRDAEHLLQTIREQTVEALEPDEDSTVTCIRRGRGHTEEEDWQNALRTIRELIDNAAVKREVNGG